MIRRLTSWRALLATAILWWVLSADTRPPA